MRRMLLLATSLSLLLSACMPAFLQGLTNPTPSVDVAATAAALDATLAAQTLQALPTPTLVPSSTPVIAEPSATQTATLPPSETATVTGTPPTATMTITGTLPTSTLLASGTAAPLTASPTNVTGTPGTLPASSLPASITPTMGIRYYGTIPPLVPSGRVIMMNKSHAEAYISFQCTNQEGTLTVMEFPVERWREEKIPSGKCKYVAWVGGRQFVGSFTLDTGGQKKILFYKDRVGIN